MNLNFHTPPNLSILRLRLGVDNLDRNERERRGSLVLFYLLVFSKKEKKGNGRIPKDEMNSSQNFFPKLDKNEKKL